MTQHTHTPRPGTRCFLQASIAATALLLGACAGMNKPDAAAGAGGTPGTAGTAGSAGQAGKPYVWSRSMEAKRLALVGATRESGIAVVRTQDNQLQLNVPSDFSFDTDSAVIKPGMAPVLDEIAADLELPALANMLILVVGHTDDRGPETLNEALSVARAVAVRRYFESKGVAAKRIVVQGRGERQPLVGNDRDYGRALNRRVEIFLREPGV